MQMIYPFLKTAIALDRGKASQTVEPGGSHGGENTSALWKLDYLNKKRTREQLKDQ